MRLRHILWLLALMLTLSFISSPMNFPLSLECAAVTQKAKVASNKKKQSARKKKTGGKRVKTSGKKKSNKKSSRKNSRQRAASGIQVLLSDPATGEWIHKGKKGIVIHRDTSRRLRAMAVYTGSSLAGEGYAGEINKYSEILKPLGVKVYSLVAPTQGEYYMPPVISEQRSQKKEIAKWAKYLDSDVTAIFVCDTLECHTEEEIYNRTDHHWAPLGAYYAAKVVAQEMGRNYLPLNEYTPDTVRNYIGTMFKFSGDKEILSHPEEFVYYIPPGDYYAEFIDYTLGRDGVAISETPSHEGRLLKKFPDGSGAAYSTFLGGDNHTVKVVNRNDTSGRKLLIVKDSYGNALVPCLLNSFDEVHVIDFRHYPHNLPDYIRDNYISDVLFVNCIELAFSKATEERLNKLRKYDTIRNNAR